MSALFGKASIVPASNPPNIADWNEKHIKQAAMAFFHSADKDNTNTMDCSEIEKFLKDLNGVSAKYSLPKIEDTQERAVELLEEYDADEDGTMSIAEFEPLFTSLVEDMQKKSLVTTVANDLFKFALGVAPEITPEVFEEAAEQFLEASEKAMTALNLDEELLEERNEWTESTVDSIKEVFEEAFDEEPATANSLQEYLDAVLEEVDVEIPTPLPPAKSTACKSAGPISKKAPKPAKAAVATKTTPATKGAKK